MSKKELTSPEVYTGHGFKLSNHQLAGTTAALQLALLLAALDQTVVSTAMPEIVGQLKGFDRYPWVTTAYLLSSTVSTPICGKLSDIFGRKWLFIGSVFFFVLASLACGTAGQISFFPGDGMSQLIAFRSLQGLFAGGMLGLIFTVIGDLYAPAERGKYQGLFAAVFAISSLAGPTIGGAITDNFSWPWVFYLNLPVGVLSMLLMWSCFPEFTGARAKQSIDFGGAVLLAGFLILLLLGFNRHDLRADSPTVDPLFLVPAAVAFALFVIRETRANNPIVPLPLFRNPAISISLMSIFMTGIGLFGSILLIPLFFQSVFQMSALAAGSHLTPLVLTVSVCSAISGFLVFRSGRYKMLILLGLALMTIGTFLLSTITVNTPVSLVLINMVIVGTGLGLLLPIHTIIIQNSSGRATLGVATSLSQLFRSIGGVVGTGLFGSIMQQSYLQRLTHGLPVVAPATLLPLLSDPLDAGALVIRVDEALKNSHLSGLVIDCVRESLLYSINQVFFLYSVALLLTFLLNIALPEKSLARHDH